MKAIAGLFGAKQEGPSASEQAAQTERQNQANRANAEADAKVALASRATSLRRSLAYNDQRKGTLGG